MTLSLERLLEIACEGSEDQLATEERAQFDRFMRRVRIHHVNTPSLIGQTGSKTRRDQPDDSQLPPRRNGSGSQNRRWPWITLVPGLAASLVVAFAAGRLSYNQGPRDRVASERNAALSRVAELEIELTRERGLVQKAAPDSEHVLRLTTNKANKPVDWSIMLQHHYDPRFTPEENLLQLEKVSGSVREEAARMRRVRPAATVEEILTALFEAWGRPNR